MSDFNTERMCRLNGKKPTAKERWTAFYRLWRLAHGHGGVQDMAAEECFRVLFPNWQPMRMLEDNVPTLSRVHWPKFLRWRFLEQEKRHRLGLYGDKLEHMKRVCHKVRQEHGMEVLPEEVAEVRLKVIKLARDKALADGVKLPQDDDELFSLLCEGMRKSQ